MGGSLTGCSKGWVDGSWKNGWMEEWIDGKLS